VARPLERPRVESTLTSALAPKCAQHAWVPYMLSWPSPEERVLARQVRPIGWFRGRRVELRDPARRPGLVRGSQRTGGTETIGQFPAGLDVGTRDLTPARDAIVCSLIEPKSDAWIMGNFDPDIR